MNHLNVIQAGAKGDGITDDTKIFQQLIDQAAQTQGTIEVPTGRYRVSQLTMRPNVGMVGSPTFAWKGVAGSVLELIDDNSECLLDISEARGCRISGLCIDGRQLGDRIHGISCQRDEYLEDEDSPLIENTKVSHFSGDGIHLDHIWCFRIRGSMSYENGGHGLAVQGFDGFVLDNWFSMNHGAGIGSIGENNAITITGNRIEWNRKGGLHIIDGSHYNITGNYIDRCNPAIRFECHHPSQDPAAVVGRTGYSTITGNILYRSGKPEWLENNEDSDAHLILKGAQGINFTGNSMMVGRDDTNNEGSLGFSLKPNWSPQKAMVLEGLKNAIIKDNTMDSGATETLIEDLGKHASGVLIKDNVGDLFQTEGDT